MEVLTLEIPSLLPHIHITAQGNLIELLNDDFTRFYSVNHLFELSGYLVYLYVSETT